MTEFVLGGGCFWCIDAVFRKLRGVELVESGYAGGEGEPDYYHVASGRTDFAEVVRVRFDETIIPADILLDIFFLIHNPTTLNQQGADIGPQYRSTMMYASDTESDLFTAAKERTVQHWDNPIVTEIVPLANYHKAEDEHQDYFNKQPASGYCSIVIAPKIVKARSAYAKWFNKEEEYDATY